MTNPFNIYDLPFIPISSLFTREGSWGGDLFPDNDYGNASASWCVPARFMWDGTGREVMRVLDDDGTFHDNYDNYQILAEPFGCIPAGTPVETQYGYTLQGSDGCLRTIYTVNFGSGYDNNTVSGIISNFPLDPCVTYRVTSQFPIANAPYASIVCFCSGTMIEAPDGPVPVEDLAIGDTVLTKDRGAQPIRWIGKRQITPRGLEANEKLRPIRITAGALGAGLPQEDLLVSPQHRILVRSKIARRMFGSDEVLVPAVQLCRTDGVDVAHDVAETTYYHLMFDNHEVLWANGALAESLYPGEHALNALGPAARAELMVLFPELASGPPASARPLVKGRQGRTLTQRHHKNNKSLYCAETF